MILRLDTDAGVSVVIAGDRILPQDTPADVTIAVGAGTLYPGLINAHDHLHRNHFPRLGTPPYADAYEWGEDIHARAAAPIARARAVPRRDALLFGALKNVLGAATTVIHHDAHEPLFDDGFPLRVPRVQNAHSIGLERAIVIAPDQPYCIHLAEGTNTRAAGEAAELERRGLLTSMLIAVHVVGIDDAGSAALAAADAAMVWCPTSNQFLFGRTAPRALLESGLDVLLGTDSMLTGAGTLLDELRAARACGYLSDARLLDAVSATAARRFGLPMPSLSPGGAADIILLRAPILDASTDDVSLVMVGGRPLLVDSQLGAVRDACAADMRPLALRGTVKLIDAALWEAAQRVLEAVPDAARLFD